MLGIVQLGLHGLYSNRAAAPPDQPPDTSGGKGGAPGVIDIKEGEEGDRNDPGQWTLKGTLVSKASKRGKV